MMKVTGTSFTGIVVSIIVIFHSIGLASEGHRPFYQVQKISCGSCLRKIDTKLKQLDGYIGMAPNFERNLIAVNHLANLAEQEIVKALKFLGYPAKEFQSNSATCQMLKSESLDWKKPSNSLLSRILKLIKH